MQYFNAQQVYRRFGFGLLLGSLLLFGLFSGGCKSLQSFCFGTKPSTPIPIIFATTPTLEQVKLEVNKRYTSIASLSTNDAVISASFTPVAMRSCSIAFEKPKRLRILAGAVIGWGTEVDIGSNDELFWFWGKRMQPKAIYYAYHQQFAASSVRSMIPIEPEWLLETLGLIELKETDEHSGPVRAQDGSLQITSRIPTPRGVYSRVLTIHPQTGAFLKYEIRTPNGRPFIGAIMSEHTVDPLHGILYAKKIDIVCPDADATLGINLGDVKFNTTGGASPEAFVMPRYEEYIPKDLCGPEVQQQFMQQQQQYVQPQQQYPHLPNQQSPTVTPFQGAPSSNDFGPAERYIPQSGADFDSSYTNPPPQSVTPFRSTSFGTTESENATAGSSASTATYFRAGNF